MCFVILTCPSVVQSCGWSDALKCGGVVASCGAICYASLGVGCATCAGSSYSTCKDCFSELYKAEKQGMQTATVSYNFINLVWLCTV